MLEFLLVPVVGLNVWADFVDRRAAFRSDAAVLSLWTTIIQFLLVMPLLGLVSRLTPAQFVLCAAVGGYTALARIPWYSALSIPGQKLSRLAPFTRLSSVLVIVLAFTLLGETYSPGKLAGALLMVAGALAISLDRSFTSLRDFLVGNRELALVLIFASSLAVLSVFYKYMMNAGVAIITTYFFLKLFQCVVSVANGLNRRILRRGLSAIRDLQLFVQARTLQTLAAFLYLFVLRHVDLSKVEPIAAAIGPLLYLSIDKVSEWRTRSAPAQSSQQVPAATASNRTYFALLGSATSALGLYLIAKG